MESKSTSVPAAGSLTELLSEIQELTSRNREQRDPERDRRILWLRHLAGIETLREAGVDPQFVERNANELPAADSNLIEIDAADLTAPLLRAAILEHGCLLVRGLIDRAEAIGLAEDIEAAFAVRGGSAPAELDADGLYEEFVPHPPFSSTDHRDWIEMGGGLLAVDSPRTMFTVLEALDRAKFPDVVRGYLGEPPLLSVEKTTLRKAEPEVAGNWHQDGSFLGEVRALNLWLSLSRCGDEAPGLDIVPRRLDLLPTGVWIQVADSAVEGAAAEAGFLRPIFEPGDALLFDELFLHKTGSDPEMPKPRYALESWFFGASAFSPEYAPVAV